MITARTRNIKKDLKKIQKFSALVEKKLSNFDKDAQKIEKLSFEELQDLNRLLQVAEYLLTKYEDKRHVYNLLKDFVEMINDSSDSMDFLNDKIGELVVSAESTISRIKTLQCDVTENFSLLRPKTSHERSFTSLDST